MCYAYGSIDQAIGVCPMCKVFKPSGNRCPHIKDICRNRTLHPRHDVVYLKNAEVQTFNGCGYCKWARKNSSPKSTGYQNPGWPGCCRPPNTNEHRLIQAADWLAVSAVHHVAIPTEIKTLLDSLTSRASPIGGGRANSGPSSIPPLDRRNSNSSPSNKPGSSGKASSVAIPGKSRPTGSPQQTATPLSGTISKASGANFVPSSLPNYSSLEQPHSQRRPPIPEFSEKRTESTQPSPSRRNVDLEGSIGRRSSSRRPTITASTPPSFSAKAVADNPPRFDAPRRSSISNTSSLSQKSSSPSSRSTEHRSDSITSRTHTKRPPLEVSMTGLKISSGASSASSASSSDGSSSHGSLTDGTVTSDGGFTDYLSDESEAELQRQAEARAALVAQNQAEELEFRAARERLTHVDLRPPKVWNPSNGSQRLPAQVQSATRA